MTLFRVRSITLALVAAMTFSGCAMTIDSRTLGVETLLASDPNNPAIGEKFKVDKKAVFMFWGLTQPGKASLTSVLGGQAQGDQKIADLRIKVRSRFIDVFFTILTLGLVVPRSVTYEGVIVSGTGN
ncbi:MAG: hypothetical protein V3T56_00150 [Gemmatimonadales bacterium]